MGLRYRLRYRSAAEFWLLGTRSRPVQTLRAMRNLIVAPVREHSRKPDGMHADLETMLARGPSRPCWELQGDEVGRFEAT